MLKSVSYRMGKNYQALYCCLKFQKNCLSRSKPRKHSANVELLRKISFSPVLICLYLICAQLPSEIEFELDGHSYKKKNPMYKFARRFSALTLKQVSLNF